MLPFLWPVELVFVYQLVMLLTAVKTLVTVASWILYLIVAALSIKFFFGKLRPVGKMPAVVASVIGAAIGSGINYALGASDSLFAFSGITMGVVGTLLFLLFYKKYREKKENVEI